jgi:hypothetical protein
MPEDTHLNTEHIKSHLQKYRIHRQRSKDEFMAFFNDYIKNAFQQWDESRSWKRPLLDSAAGERHASHSFLENSSPATDNVSANGYNGVGLSAVSTASMGDEGTHIAPAERTVSNGDENPNFEYAAELFAETNLLLQSLHSLSKEAAQCAEAIKQKQN